MEVAVLGRTVVFVYLLVSIPAFARKYVLDLSDMDAHKTDVRLSGTIVDIYGELQKGKIPAADVKKALKKIDRSRPLGIFKPSLRRVLSLMKPKSLSKTIKTCSFKVSSSSVVKVFDVHIGNICHDLVLNALVRGKMYKKLDKNFLGYIERNVDGFLEGDRAKKFAKYLGKVYKGGSLHKDLSTMVGNSYKKRRRKIHPDIMASIHIDSAFMDYIHSHNLMSLNEGILFDKEFHQLKKEVYKQIKANKMDKAREAAAQLMGFHKQNNDLIKKTRSRNVFLVLAKVFFRKEDFKTSNLINRYVFQVSEGSISEKASFEILFNLIRQKKYDRAIGSINELGLLKNFDDFGSKLQYWIAYSIEMYGQETLSELLFRRLVKNNPLSFYSIIAYKRKMSPMNASKDFVKSFFIARNVASTNQTYKEVIDNFKRLRLWIGHDKRAFVTEEIEDIFDTIKSNPKKFSRDDMRYIALQIGRMINKENKFLYTFKLIHELLDRGAVVLDDGLLKLLFPDPYFDKIQKHNLGLDPYLILSLIRQESAFDPDARSIAGARGLMQLMPATARQLRRRVKIHQLRQPDMNLRLGIKYLKYLVDKYDGNLIYALAGYNAGERRVGQWMEEIFNSDNPLVIIEMIPYRETRNYIKLIYRNFFFYRFLYHQNTSPDNFIPGKLTYFRR